MTDYTHSTGNSGTMMIRDLGSTVEFWLNSNNGTTFNHQLPYGWTVNGSTGTSTYDYSAGAGWRKLRSFTVTTSQTVTFRLFDTGTSGFGGPTTFNQFIDRATAPHAPAPPTFSNVSFTTLTVSFGDGANNGATIDQRQIGYGTSPTTQQTIINTGNSANITNLSPGVVYYFWARTHNAKGWSPWSSASSVRTLAGVRIKVGGVWKTALAYVKVGGVWKPTIPYVKVSGTWKKTG